MLLILFKLPRRQIDPQKKVLKKISYFNYLLQSEVMMYNFDIRLIEEASITPGNTRRDIQNRSD